MGLEHGCPGAEDVCLEAAWRGKLASLQCARQAGCPWGEGTCLVAASEGHLGVLRWAFDNGGPCDLQWCLMDAHACGHCAVVAWCDARLDP